jgi:hypothetical protein
MSKIDEFGRIANFIANYDWEANQSAKKEYKTTWIMAVVGTIIVIVICLAVMYLRFRVFGR